MKKRSPLLPIFLIVSVDVLGLTIVLPLLPFYAEKYGASPFVVGLLVTCFAFCQLLSGPALGKISDRIGRRPLLLISQFGTFVGFLVLAFANSLPLIFLSRIIDGTTAGNITIAQAYISDVTEPQNRAKAFGLIGIAFGMGFLFGPAISGFLSQYGYQYPIFAAAALSLTSILATYFLLPKNRPVHADDAGQSGRKLGILDWKNYLKYFKRPELSILLRQFFLFYFAFALFTSGFALFAERRLQWQGHPFGPREVGFVFAYAGFLGVILQGGFIGKLVKRFGEERLVLSGFLAALIGYAALAFTHDLGLLLVGAAVSAYGTGVLRPALMSLVTQRSARNEQGMVLGVTQSLNSVAQITAPLAAGFLINQRWLAHWALLAAAMCLIGFLLSLRLIRLQPSGASQFPRRSY